MAEGEQTAPQEAPQTFTGELEGRAAWSLLNKRGEGGAVWQQLNEVIWEVGLRRLEPEFKDDTGLSWRLGTEGGKFLVWQLEKEKGKTVFTPACCSFEVNEDGTIVGFARAAPRAMGFRDRRRQRQPALELKDVLQQMLTAFEARQMGGKGKTEEMDVEEPGGYVTIKSVKFQRGDSFGKDFRPDRIRQFVAELKTALTPSSEKRPGRSRRRFLGK